MSSTAMMNPAQSLQHPHRKPVPARASYNNLQQAQAQQPPAQYPVDQRTYSRTTTNSSSSPANTMYTAPSVQPQQLPQRERRTLSNATSSTASTTNAGLQRAPTNASQPRRSTSSRSTNSASPTSYVALMRKQKATVWCDRAQVENPEILARRRAIKMQAAKDVAGGSHRFSSSSNNAPQSIGIRSKIRHHGLPKANQYTGQGNLAGAGVPLRLSATEVDENDSDEEQDSKYMKQYHSRNGSRGSSFNSGRQPNNNYLSSGNGRGYSSGSTPRSGHSPVDSTTDVADETPMPNQYGQQAGGYFEEGDEAAEEAKFGGVGGLPQRTKPVPQEGHTSDDLRRRGSVDDRTMTMSGVRLFVANPDLSD
ncbi:uncharacterized protein LTR77_009696 [Saxophila tyrrhenica]|uniref:Uncharacterized protein n=1 Tax=Saxophila tyrrhenica TaxID=1690608 RepID=A0AAV9P0U5_9PEZI|nr:hypothetical protein LTR77_009696 [Saxophila tyrrhenica]